MNKLKRVLIGILSLCMLFSISMAVACGPTDPPPTGYTVTFMVEGEQYGNQQTVQRGRRVVKPADPTFSNEGYVFTGWYTSETFEEGTLWNFTTGIVNQDVTLYAGYRVVTAYVTEVGKANEPITSKLVWTQLTVSQATDYTVVISNESGETTLTGSVEFDAENYKVTFTPNVIPQGGIYNVSVKDNTQTEEACVVEDVVFNGAGTETNPYLVASALDFTAVNGANVAQGTHFSLIKSISIVTNREAQKDFEFNGTFVGNGRTITISGNTGAIYKIGANGVVKQVSIAGALSTALNDSIGALADFNAGRVEKINTTANVENSGGTVGTSGIQNALNESLEDGAGNRGIAGGIVGTNLVGGVVYNCKITTSSSSTGTVKAAIGGGTIVGYNKGTIELCTSNGCVGAWNSKETGKSTSNYSYCGGIAGINAGTITKSTVNGSGKLLAQRIKSGTITEGTTNANIGGIAGYNMAGATINESYFEGIRVHGDENVGGIAGLNAGAIANCYVAGVYNSTTKIYTYVGGRTNVGGLVGKTEVGASVTNCFVTANVYAYGENGVAYAAAENASNVVYLTANLNAKSSDDGNTNPNPATLIAPTGNNNVAIEVTNGSADGVTTNYAIAQSYLTTINGAEKFIFEDTIKLGFIKNIPEEATIEVELYNADGTLFKEVEVAETGASINGPVLQGHVFNGWAVAPNGAVVFGKSVAISMYDLLDYQVAGGKVKLYANMSVRIPNEGLIVAIYDRYVEADATAGASEAIENAFKAWMAQNGYTYEVEFRHYTGSSLGVADFGAMVNNDGDIDVLLGAGANITSTGKVAYLSRAYMTYEGLTDRYACLLTDTERAVDFYAFVTGTEKATATINFNVNTSVTGGSVDSILGTTVTAPTVTAPNGYEFIGWATTENATEAEVVGTALGYKDVKDLLNEGSVTLYPVIVEKQADLVVYIHLSASSTEYITELEADAIESAIATLYADKVVNFVRVTGKNAAGFATEVINGNADIYIGGNNAGDVQFDAQYGKTGVGAGHFANTSRKVGIINNCANKSLAITLYQYLTAEKVN